MDISLPAGTFDALIFDCDGTLVDTAPAHLSALQQALRAHGLDMTPEWYYPKVGLSPAALWDQYDAEIAPSPIPRAAILKLYTEAFQKNLDRLQEIGVIVEIAREWYGRVPMSVASNGRRANVEATLMVTKLRPLFDHIVAAEDVKQGKPAPDVFLEAARLMGAVPTRCVVFEDSDEGLEAASRAGMRGIDIREVHQVQR